MDSLRERRELRVLLQGLPRSKKQINDLFEADAEILKLSAKDFLVASTDSIGEEITMGLYKDPETWGWITAMASISDLSATGAEGLGLLVSSQWAFGTDVTTQKRFNQGLAAALRKTKLPLLGGDSGSAKDHVFTSTILGRAEKKPLTRLGVKPGDSVFLCGRRKTGAGPALAYRFLRGLPAIEFEESYFRPIAPHAEMRALRSSCVAAIDTSDGIATSLAIVSKLNNVGFDLEWKPETLHPEAAEFCRKHGFPPEMLWMGDHGDFQPLVFARGRHADALAKKNEFIRIGRATPARAGLTLRKDGGTRAVPVDRITTCGRDLASYVVLVNDLIDYFK